MTPDRRVPGEVKFPDLVMIGRVETSVERGGKIEKRAGWNTNQPRALIRGRA